MVIYVYLLPCRLQYGVQFSGDSILKYNRQISLYTNLYNINSYLTLVAPPVDVQPGKCTHTSSPHC